MEKSDDTHLDTSSLLATFHSTGRCYAHVWRRKVLISLALLVKFNNNWIGKTGLLVQ